MLVSKQYQFYENVGDEELAKVFEKVEECESLVLSRNYITRLSVKLNFDKLVTLNLGVNCLKSIPVLENGKLLKHLYVNNNSIRELKHLENYPNLVTLDVRQNLVQVLKLPITCRGLKWFSISNNRLEEVEEDLPELVQLEKLCLFGNTSLPKKDCTKLLRKCCNVREIYIGGTGIASFPRAKQSELDEIIQWVPKLEFHDGRHVSARMDLLK